MQGIFLKEPPENRLDGWIVGTAGAVRYPLPPGVSAGPAAQTDVYGYLLGTVQRDGTIDFTFQEVQESDIPKEVSLQYPQGLISWCFRKNSLNSKSDSDETTNRCIPAASPAPNTPGRTP